MGSSKKIIKYISLGFGLTFLTIVFLFLYLYFSNAKIENLITTQASRKETAFPAAPEVKNLVADEEKIPATEEMENYTKEEVKKEERLDTLETLNENNQKTLHSQKTAEAEEINKEKIKRLEILKTLSK
jgi:hypothetical protein